MKHKTTHKILLNHKACSGRHEHLRNAMPEKSETDGITLQEIYYHNGFDDALWAVDSGSMGEEARRLGLLFGCYCASRVLHLYERGYPEDMRPSNAIAAQMQYLIGEIDAAARDAAWAAAGAAAGAAARDAARAAARDAARSAAWSAAWAAARDAAWAAARDAARAAARDAARAAARDAAWSAERQHQEDVFCDLFGLEGK